jgi:hypothetical protein|tara:strand:+ start:90 stop:1061 length:972 start_codon:yes stop_codon:yes gene_type:complete
MLPYLPYALAAYGGYKGYRSSKDAGGSGIQRLLGGATGAALGYYGGQAGLKGLAPESFAAFSKTAPTFLPQLSATGSDTIFKQAIQKEGEEEVKRNMLQKLLQRKRMVDGKFTGEFEFDPTKAGIAAGGLAYMSGAFEQQPIDQFQPTYNLAYADYAANQPGYSYIDPATGQEKKYEKVYIPEANRPDDVERMGPYEISRTRLKTGGLAEIKKFNEGGINYLPSKVSHNENDANNYVRASGYVEDGAGVGDKDEDTMLAQLADGEFVTRADGVLGAGIIAGANPKSMKDMREKGAQYFYDQQKKYKRVFDLIKDNNETKKEKN